MIWDVISAKTMCQIQGVYNYAFEKEDVCLRRGCVFEKERHGLRKKSIYVFENGWYM